MTDPNRIRYKVNTTPLDHAPVPPPPTDAQPLKLGVLEQLPPPVSAHSPAGDIIDARSIPPIDIIPNSVIGQPVGQVRLVPIGRGMSRTLGRLYVTFDGQVYHCTAQFVGALNVILTAGHGVFDEVGGAGFFSDAVFYAGFNDGCYTSAHRWQCAAVYSGWADQRIYHYDFGFIKLHSAGTAALGLQGNTGRSPMTSLGYSQGFYDARQAVYVNGPVAPAPSNPAGKYSGCLHMPGNDLEEGSSGGAWVYDAYAESVNSFNVTGYPDDMYGPKFDSSAMDLFDFVKKGCVTENPR